MGLFVLWLAASVMAVVWRDATVVVAAAGLFVAALVVSGALAAVGEIRRVRR